MKVKAERVSKMSDNQTWALPERGYDTDSAVEIDLSAFEEVCSIEGDLPENDQEFPKGAPYEDHFKYSGSIYRKTRS